MLNLIKINDYRNAKTNNQERKQLSSQQMQKCSILTNKLSSEEILFVYDINPIFSYMYLLYKENYNFFEHWIIIVLHCTFPSSRSSVFVRMLSSLSFSSLGSVQLGSSASALLKSSMANLYSSWNLYAYKGMMIKTTKVSQRVCLCK